MCCDSIEQFILGLEASSRLAIFTVSFFHVPGPSTARETRSPDLYYKGAAQAGGLPRLHEKTRHLKLRPKGNTKQAPLIFPSHIRCALTFSSAETTTNHSATYC